MNGHAAFFCLGGRKAFFLEVKSNEMFYFDFGLQCLPGDVTETHTIF